MDISESYVEQFSGNVLQMFQQRASKLRGTTREQQIATEAETDEWERIGPVSAVVKAGRHSPTPRIKTPHSVRLAPLSTWEWADLIDLADAPRLLLDPRSELVTAGSSAMGRQFDLALISAFDANAYSVDDALATFTSECAGDFDFSTSAMTVAKLLRIKEALDDNDVPEEDRHIVACPSVLTQLLKNSILPNVSSEDFNRIKALVRGDIEYFLGFNWHKSTLLPTPAMNKRFCYSWNWRAVGMSIGEDITTRVTERADYSYSTQVHLFGTFGAVRVMGEGVVRFKIDETK